MSFATSRSTPLRGFRLLLEGAQLTDLIQVVSQNQSHAAFEVRALGSTGRLFFEAGRLVHAEFEGQVGMAAVVRLLMAQGGEAFPMDRPASVPHTIDMSSDTLLIRAAQQLDETLRARAGREGPITGVVARVSVDDDAPEHGRPRPLASTSRRGDRIARPLRAVRMSRSGSSRVLEDGADDALAERVLLATQAATALARQLELGNVRALCLAAGDERLVVHVGESITGVEGPPEALTGLARRLGVE